MRNIRRIFGPALLSAGVIALVASSALAQRGNTPNPEGPQARAEQPNAPGFTQRQLENVEARVATTNAILSRLEGQAKAQGRAGVWRQSTLEALLGLPLRALQQVERDSYNVDALAAAIRGVADDPSLIGDPSEDLVYTPMPPCRYIDTRGGPKILNGAPRAFDLANNGATYGGSAACSVQQNVVAAIAMNVTITEPSGAPGFLAVKPTLAAPLTSFMNWYEAGNHVQLANSGVVTVDQTGAGPEFFIQVSEATHVLADFFGVFQEPEATALDTVIQATAVLNIAAGGVGSFDSPACPVGYVVTGGTCLGNSFDLDLVQHRRLPPNSWRCSWQNPGAATTVQVETICARIPGR